MNPNNPSTSCLPTSLLASHDKGVELATRERERSTGGGISVSSTSGSSHRLTSRPPAPTSDRASGGRPHNHTEGAAPPSPSPANTAGGTSHQGIHERRAAVRDRVAQEVLAFIAAIERGDAATAAGFPPPPGAAAGGVVGAGGLLGGAGQGSAAVPASREAVEKLPRIEVCHGVSIVYLACVGASSCHVGCGAVCLWFAVLHAPPRGEGCLVVVRCVRKGKLCFLKLLNISFSTLRSALASGAWATWWGRRWTLDTIGVTG